MSNLNSSPHRLETFHVDCKHSWPSQMNIIRMYKVLFYTTDESLLRIWLERKKQPHGYIIQELCLYFSPTFIAPPLLLKCYCCWCNSANYCRIHWDSCKGSAFQLSFVSWFAKIWRLNKCNMGIWGRSPKIFWLFSTSKLSEKP